MVLIQVALTTLMVVNKWLQEQVPSAMVTYGPTVQETELKLLQMVYKDKTLTMSMEAHRLAVAAVWLLMEILGLKEMVRADYFHKEELMPQLLAV